MATRKEDKSKYFPDVAVQRRSLTESLRGARQRWHVLEVERKARLKVIGKAKLGGSGNVPAVAYLDNAAEQLKTMMDTRVAQVLSEQQQFEAEIDTYMDELDQLPEEPVETEGEG